MSPRAKVQAGGIVRKSIDLTWQTPEWLVELVRPFFPGNVIPFDPATAPHNPTKATRFCAGPPGRMFEGMTVRVVNDHKPGVIVEAGVDHMGRPENVHPSLFSPDPPREIPVPADPILASKNGLEVSWDWPFWVNPPFKRDWIEKIGVQGERQQGIALLPNNRTEMPFMQRTLSVARGLCFVDAAPFQPGIANPHRIAFISSIDGVAVAANPYASIVLGFGFEFGRFEELLHPLGLCVDLRKRAA